MLFGSAFGGGHGALDEGKEAARERVVEVLRGPGAGFEFAEAADAPEILGELIDQDLFGSVGRVVLAAERGAQVIKLGGIFAGKNELLRIEAVLEGILGGAQFAGDGFWSSGVLGIGAIGSGAVGGGAVGGGHNLTVG